MTMLDHLNQGWILTLLSSVLCILGCFIIFIDDVYKLIFPKSFTKKYPFELKENFGFLIACLSFSGGCLIFTSLYRLLPTGYNYLDDSGIKKSLINKYLIGAFIFGLVVCLMLNGVLHMITSESVVHCSHDLEGGDHFHEDDQPEHHHDHDHDHDHSHSHSHNQSHNHNQNHNHNHNHNHAPNDDLTSSHQEEMIQVTETTSLIKPGLTKRFSLIHLFGKDDVGECKGYSSAEICVNDSNNKLHYCELPLLKRDVISDATEIHSIHSSDIYRHQSHDSGHDHAHSFGHSHYHDDDDHHGDMPDGSTNKSIYSDHHHHISTPLSRLLMIGIQTTLAITLHKFPEGFITYITSEADAKLGVEIFLSLLVHNFIEGFSMCLPLYYSFSNASNNRYAKLKALLIGGGLGGISQPLGGILGMIFLKISDYNMNDLNFVFGITMSVTAGFLTVVSLSMFGSAIGFNARSSNYVIIWTLIGMSVIGGSLMLKE